MSSSPTCAPRSVSATGSRGLVPGSSACGAAMAGSRWCTGGKDELGTQTKFKAELLPPAVREEMDRWLIDREFHNSHKLAAELRARGFDIGNGAMARYAGKLRRERQEERSELARTRLAIELEAASSLSRLGREPLQRLKSSTSRMLVRSGSRPSSVRTNRAVRCRKRTTWSSRGGVCVSRK
jgi:hypothetical protein